MSRTTRRRRTRRPRRSAETPEDADAAQEPERRVRPRETPVGAGAATAPEPEEEEEEEEEEDVAVVPPNADRAAAHESVLRQMDQALTELPEGSEGQRAVLGTLVLAARDARNDVAAMENADGDTVAVPPAPPRTAVRSSLPVVLHDLRIAGSGEFEVDTGRVVHQETIEGEPPRNSERHEYVIPH